MADTTAPSAPPAFNDDPSHQPNCSNNDLGDFHAKYQDNEGGHPLQPLLRFLSQTNAPAVPQRTQEQQQRRRRRAQHLRAKRQHLRELQEWEYKTLTTPKRWANAGPVGLLGFGMTTILLNLHNTGHFPLDTVIPGMGICFGGGAQLIAGLLEWTRGNTFAAVAFVSYGAFWLSLVCLWMLPNSSFKMWSTVTATSQYFTGAYLIIWGVFTFFMTLCTLRMNLAMFLLFFTLTLLFFWLAGGNMAGNATALHAAGYEGIVCGSIALYLAFAEILNEVWDRTILPVFPMTQVLGWFARDGDGSKKASEKAESSHGMVYTEEGKLVHRDELV